MKLSTYLATMAMTKLHAVLRANGRPPLSDDEADQVRAALAPKLGELLESVRATGGELGALEGDAERLAIAVASTVLGLGRPVELDSRGKPLAQN